MADADASVKDISSCPLCRASTCRKTRGGSLRFKHLEPPRLDSLEAEFEQAALVEPVLQGLQPEEGLGACNGITVAASEPPKDASSGAFGKNKIGRNKRKKAARSLEVSVLTCWAH